MILSLRKTLAFIFLGLLFNCASSRRSASLSCGPDSYAMTLGRVELQESQNRQGLLRIQEMLTVLNAKCPGPHPPKPPPDTCSEIYERGNKVDGVYYANFGGRTVYIYCQFHKSGTHWIVFQRRVNDSVDFFRDWIQYKEGFGEKHHNFWLGLENLNTITRMRRYQLRVDMEDWNGNTAYAEYRTFEILSEGYNYTIKVKGYHGTAGDSLSIHHNHAFSTKGCDHDASPRNCANEYLGAWWYANCHLSNLNGFYYDGGKCDPKGVTWRSWKGRHYSLRKVEMKMRPIIWV